jgi:hypothetical protein
LTRSRAVLWPVVVLGAVAQIFLFWNYAWGRWAY